MPTRIKITRLLTAAVLVAGTAVAGNGQTSDQAQLAGLPSFADGVEAYIYGYPLVVMAMTERVVTTTPNATTMLGRAPINQFAKQQRCRTLRTRTLCYRVQQLSMPRRF